MTPNPLPAPQGQPTQKSSNAAVFIIIGVVVLFGCCGVGGILSAIAIPNFIKFQARSKQSECKTNLKGVAVAESSYFAEHDTYTDEAEFFTFIENNRYAYVIGGTVVAPKHAGAPKAGLVEQLPAEIRQALVADEERYMAACVGSVDNDATVDVWTVSSEDRVIKGERVPAGTPHNDVNDVVD